MAAHAAQPISPSGNGRHSTTFQVQAKSSAAITHWEFRIARESDGKVLRTQKGTDQPPKELSWDGKDDKGRSVADGRYLYVLQVWDEAGNTSFSEEKTIDVDSTAPAIALSVEALPDSMAVMALTAPDDPTGYGKWKVEVHSPQQAVVRSFSGEGAPPKEVLWDLRDDRGQLVPEGKYDASFYAEDGAGNHTDPVTAAVDLSGMAAPALPLSFGVKSMIVGGDGKSVENVTFGLKPAKAADIKGWSVEVRNEAGIVVKKFEGKGLPPPTISWDGKSADGQLVADGIKCRYVLKVVPVGEGAQAKPLAVAVDATLAPRSSEISRATFHLKQLPRNVNRWVLDIANPAGNVVSHYEGQGSPPSQVTWDGRDNQGNPVPDAVFCRYVLRVYDPSGKVMAMTNPLSVATLSRVTRKYTIPGVQFDFAKADLRPDGKARLGDAVDYLGQHPNSDVLIEGHTCNIGGEAFNRELSRSRAEAVRRYMFDERGCKAAKVDVKGLGWTQPVASNATEEGRVLNRRAEVYITARVD